ncbi:MAG: hypothetical protein EOP84_02075, partial [Verrucomicrobiaceae bacterium]
VVGKEDAGSTPSLLVKAKLAGPALAGEILRVAVSFEGKEVVTAKGEPGKLLIAIPDAKWWTPDTPHLYDLKVELLDGAGKVIDTVQSYTALRTVGYGYDGSGRLETITDGTQNHLYAYHPGSSLVSTIQSRSGTTAWFRETRHYDTLSRLVGIRSDRMSGGSVTAEISSHGYDYDSLGRRTKNTFGDGSSWTYGYNDRSEVTSATRKTATGTDVPQFASGYTYDGIGNRLTSTSEVLGGRGYTLNALNQYSTITAGTTRTAVGRAPAGWTVQVAGTNATRIGEIYHRTLTGANASAPVWQSVVTRRDSGTPTTTNYFWYPKASTTPTYDLDGNLTNDGRWVYTWDAEHRLIQMETTTQATTAGHPYTKLKFVYDWQGRRIARTVWQGATFGSATVKSNRRWIYDGWNVIAEFSAADDVTPSLTRLNTFTWGLDLSGTFQGAGGVGGLLVQTAVSGGVLERASYDGNGNVVAWTKSTASAPTSRREYDAFGNTLVSEGVLPSSFGFSTKMQDSETGLYYFGYRYYDALIGRWPSRDLIGEQGGLNLYNFVKNRPLFFVDKLGLAPCPCDCDGAEDLTKGINRAINRVISDYKGNTAGGLRAEFENKFIKDGKFENLLQEKGKKCSKPFAASTFKLCGRCVGADKLGHFFEEGLIYHNISKMPGKNRKTAEDFGKWTEGMDPHVKTAAEYDFLDKNKFQINFQGYPMQIPNMMVPDIYNSLGDYRHGMLLDPNGGGVTSRSGCKLIRSRLLG